MVNPITDNNFASLFNCTPVGRASTQWWRRCKAIYFSWLGPELFLSVAWPTEVQLLVFFCCRIPVVVFDKPEISRCRSQHVVSVESLSLFHHSTSLSVIYFVSRDDPMMSKKASTRTEKLTICLEP